MVTETDTTTPSEASHRGTPASASRSRSGRQRGRRGSGATRRGNRNSASASTPAPSTRPESTPAPLAAWTHLAAWTPDSSNHAPSGGSNRRRFRRGGDEVRGRGASRGGAAGSASRGTAGAPRRGAAGHAFSGHLTETGLHGDAPEFVPGKTAGPRRNTQSTEDEPLAREDSLLRSTAPDIATRTHEDIAHGLYECSICTSEIWTKSKVWSCTLCWTVFHLGCIKKWSKNEGSTLAPTGPVDGDDPAPRQWRCPGCNLPKDALPSEYACWCGKDLDPRPISGVPPHSCGQTCAKPRSLPKQCPHPCELTCHAGPCPPCSHMGPVQSCFCGKDAFARRCVETNYVSGWSCGATCADVMPCGLHTCPRPCHEGLCGACEVLVDAKCYCGKEEQTMTCADQHAPKQSLMFVFGNDGEQSIQQWDGVFACKQLCGRPFDCGKHRCEEPCHQQDPISTHCPRSADTVTHCPCGKTALDQITTIKRETCEDAIPNCDQTCSKALLCGHMCHKKCHHGSCPPCTQTISITCRCGRMVSQIQCHQRTNEVPTCTRSCKSTLNCGRHECGEVCCSGEKKAQERQAHKKKLRSLDAAPNIYDNSNNIEAEHICTRVCSKPLKCGNHSCPELCHKGPCKPCREAIFEELSCHCGKTVLQPPLPCGTGAPPCRFPCDRPKACGHPAVQHNCHSSAEPCPNCPYLMEKVCLCRRKTLKNQPCFRTEVICGQVCGKRLRCGTHTCRKPCHREGDCEDAHTRCQQLCGDPKMACGHPCDDRCHNPTACKEEKPCQSKIVITCDCQHLRTETRCLATRTSEGNKGKKLKCDDECARLERNRKLALALNVDPDHQDTHVPYAAKTLELYQDEPMWALAQERELRVFAADDAELRLRCKPMPSHRRAFLHALADDFGLDSESLDPEPHRHVFLFKTPRFVKAPMKTLADCVRIRNAPPPGTGLAASTRLDAINKLGASNESYNGLLLSAPRFALTLDELRAETSAALSASASTLAFDIEFLPSEEIVFRARPSNPNTTIAPAALEALLKNLKPSFLAAIAGKKLAESVSLCALDTSLNILRRETTESASLSSGWNRVAARAATPKAPLRAPGLASVGQKSSFVVLSKRRDTAAAAASADKKKETGIIDDWEEEMKREEEREAGEPQQHEEAQQAEEKVAVDAQRGEDDGQMPDLLKEKAALLDDGHEPGNEEYAEVNGEQVVPV